MSLKNRAIVTKNDDPSITYVGEWTTVQANVVNNFGNFGPAFSPTLHSASTTSSLSFPFHGSSINVFGTINIANATKNPNPTWQCVLDGINLGSPNIFQFPENNWSLCSQGNIPDGVHELVVNVTSEGMPFYLDYIEYRPSANVSRENSLILIENTDSAINYISGWNALGTTANQTTDPKGLVNVTFVGTQLSWYGFIPTEESHNASSGEYSIDGEPFAPFQLAGLTSASAATSFNQLFFITPTLDMGTHILSAKYTGKPGQTPFTLDYLIVTNGSFPSSPGSPNGDTNKTHAPNPLLTSSKAKSSSNVGAIVGGIVGGIVVLGVAGAIIFIWLRLNRRRRLRATSEDSFGNPRRAFMESFHENASQLPSVPQPETSQIPSSLIMDSTHGTPPQSRSSTTAEMTDISNASSSSTSFYTVNNRDTYQSNLSGAVTTSDRETISQRPLPATPPIAPLQRRESGKRFLSISAIDAEPRIHHQHEDSGIRLPERIEEETFEIPPTYSEQ